MHTDSPYSTISFKIEITDPNANHGVSSSVNPDEEIYYVACIRTVGTELNTPDNCVVRGPSNRIRAIKTATGMYEIQIQNEAMYREYYAKITPYTSAWSSTLHTITYHTLGTGGTATATYDATVGTATNYFSNVEVSSTLNVKGSITVTGTTRTDGHFYAGTTAPSGSTRLNYSGNLYATEMYATNFDSTSDQRTKINISTIENALQKTLSLRGVEFDWISTGKRNIGVIAQEVEKIIPEVVTTSSDDTKSVAYGNIVGLLIEAIKEQQAQIEYLKASINK